MSISFKTDQSGANSNVCTTQSHTFNFSVSNSTNVTTAVFSLKSGSGSTDSVTVAIYDQPAGAGSVVASVSVGVASIPQTFTAVTFTFPANTNLTAGTSYSLKVSSGTSCSGNAPYSFKPGNFQVIDDTTNAVVNTGYGVSAAITATASVSETATAAYTSAAAAVSSVAAMNADPSVLQAGETNKWRHDGALAGRIYRGATRVRKARRGNNVILDQPN